MRFRLCRVEHVIGEGVGGWLVPIRFDCFASDLAAAMKFPALAVAQNCLGGRNHAVLTVRSVAAIGAFSIRDPRSAPRVFLTKLD
jgi:dethiobiotin synthetase